MTRTLGLLLLPLATGGTGFAQSTPTSTHASTPTTASAPQRFLIERDMPGASQTRPDEFRAGAAKSNAVLRELGPDISGCRAMWPATRSTASTRRPAPS